MGEVPEDYKIANVTPVFKKGKKEDLGNYTPVSLTFIPGKVIERLTLEGISRHVKGTGIMWTSQHGFTMGKSGLMNLVSFCDEVAGLIDEERTVDTFCLDIH